MQAARFSALRALVLLALPLAGPVFGAGQGEAPLSARQAEADLARDSEPTKQAVLKAYDAILDSATDPEFAIGIKGQRDLFAKGEPIAELDDKRFAAAKDVDKNTLYYALKAHRKVVYETAQKLGPRIAAEVARLTQSRQFEAAVAEKAQLVAFMAKYSTRYGYLHLAQGQVWKGKGTVDGHTMEVTMMIKRIEGNNIDIEATLHTGGGSDFANSLKCVYSYAANKLIIKEASESPVGYNYNKELIFQDGVSYVDAGGNFMKKGGLGDLLGYEQNLYARIKLDLQP